MTPLQFEELYGREWQELEALLDHALERRRSKAKTVAPVHLVKYAVAGACWLAVLGYLGWQGRRAD